MFKAEQHSKTLNFLSKRLGGSDVCYITKVISSILRNKNRIIQKNLKVERGFLDYEQEQTEQSFS